MQKTETVVIKSRDYSVASQTQNITHRGMELTCKKSYEGNHHIGISVEAGKVPRDNTAHNIPIG